MTNQSPTSGTVSAAQTTAYTYYHQYQVSASYSTSDGTTPSASITLSGTQFGNSAYTLTLTTSVQSPWLDAGTSWSVNDPIIAVSGTERWSANGVGTSGTVTGAITIAPVYYHQYQITFGYSVVNGPSIIASNLVVGSYYQFGSSLSITSDGAGGVTPSTATWVDAGAAKVTYVTATATSGTERWALTATDTKTVSGTGTLSESGYYHQYVITFGYSVVNDVVNAITSGNQIGSYTQFGAATGIINSGATYGAVTPSFDWVDAGTNTVSYTTYTNGAGTERWALLAGTNSYSVSSSTTVSEQNYYHQFKITFGYSVANDASSIASGLVIGNYYQFGASYQITSTGVGTGVSPSVGTWVDSGARKVDYQTVTASSTTERWALLNSPQNHDVTASGTLAQSNYFHQFEVSALYSTSDGSTPFPVVTLSGTQFGATSTLPLTTTAQFTWFDVGTTWSFNNPIVAGSGNERWDYTSSNSGTVTSYTVLTPMFYHQYMLTLQYSIANSPAGSPTVTDIVAYTSLGVASTATPAPSPATSSQVWADAGTAVTYASPIVAGSGTERWMVTSSDSGTYIASSSVSSAATLNPSYYHQYQVSASYSTSDSTTPSASVTLSGTQFGSSAFNLVLTTSTQNPWLDAGSGWSVNNPISASSTEQWIATSGTSGTISSLTAVAPLYYHQYKVAMSYSVSDGTTPSSPVILSGTQSGDIFFTVTLTTTVQNVWLDATTSWSVNNPITASIVQQWIATSGTSGTVSSSTAVAPLYYHQFKVSMNYLTSDLSTPSADVVLSGTQSGNPLTVTLTTSAQRAWLDAATAWSVNNPITASSNEQWIATSGTSGMVSVTLVVAPLYYHQYTVTASYSTSDSLHTIHKCRPVGNPIWKHRIHPNPNNLSTNRLARRHNRLVSQ